MIEIFTVAYNEEEKIMFFINWWRDRFQDCRITVIDNHSTDRTAEFAKRRGCRVISAGPKDKMDEQWLIDVKNSCWKESKEEWVFVGDVDEVVDITPNQLYRERWNGTTVIDLDLYDIINKDDVSRMEDIDYAVEYFAPRVEKRLIFQPDAIIETNYHIGCHVADMKGLIRVSYCRYPFFHYKRASYKGMWDRHQDFKNRYPPEDIVKGWGIHYRWGKLKYWWEWKCYCWKAIKFK